jgi:hypothetical protein
MKRAVFLLPGLIFAAILVILAFLPSLAVAQVVPSGVGVINSSGAVAAATATATLPGTGNRTTYLCGFVVSGLGATAGSAVTLAITGLASGAQNIAIGVPAGATTPVGFPVMVFTVCLPASAPNTAIVLTLPSLGTGNTAADLTVWGYQAP